MAWGMVWYRFGLVYWGLTPQQQPGSYQGGEMMIMKSVFWWRKPEYPEETTDLRQVTDDLYGIVYSIGYDMVWHGIIWRGMTWGVVWHSIIAWHGITWGMTWYSIWRDMLWHGVWYSVLWQSITQGMPWVWYGMTWYCMVWRMPVSPQSNLYYGQIWLWLHNSWFFTYLWYMYFLQLSMKYSQI